MPTASQIEWRPFQKKILKIVEGKADDRAIRWYYSIQAEVGKSRIATELVERYEKHIADLRAKLADNPCKPALPAPGPLT